MADQKGRTTSGAYSEAMKGQGEPLKGFAKPYTFEPVGEAKRDTPLDAGGSATPSGMTTK